MATEKRAGLIISEMDIEKRYDLYQAMHNEERVYENVKIIGIRSFEGPKSGWVPSHSCASQAAFFVVGLIVAA